MHGFFPQFFHWDVWIPSSLCSNGPFPSCKCEISDQYTLAFITTTLYYVSVGINPRIKRQVWGSILVPDLTIWFEENHGLPESSSNWQIGAIEVRSLPLFVDYVRKICYLLIVSEPESFQIIPLSSKTEGIFSRYEFKILQSFDSHPCSISLVKRHLK